MIKDLFKKLTDYSKAYCIFRANASIHFLFQEHFFTFVTQKEAVDSGFFQVIDYALQMLLNQMKGSAYLLEFFVVNRILDGDQMSAKHLIPQTVSIYPIFKVDVNNYATSNQIYFQSFFCATD